MGEKLNADGSVTHMSRRRVVRTVAEVRMMEAWRRQGPKLVKSVQQVVESAGRMTAEARKAAQELTRLAEAMEEAMRREQEARRG